MAGITLTRGVVETVALIFALHEKTRQFLADQNVQRFDDFLITTSMGSRNNPELPFATNILSLIDQMDKAIAGVRSTYDSLCECTHPNWAGVMGSFGEIDREAFELKLGPRAKTGYGIGVNALSGALMTFEHYYNQLAELIYNLNDHFESAGTQ